MSIELEVDGKKVVLSAVMIGEKAPKGCGQHKLQILRGSGGMFGGIGIPIWACTNKGCEFKTFSM